MPLSSTDFTLIPFQTGPPICRLRDHNSTVISMTMFTTIKRTRSYIILAIVRILPSGIIDDNKYPVCIRVFNKFLIFRMNRHSSGRNQTEKHDKNHSKAYQFYKSISYFHKHSFYFKTFIIGLIPTFSYMPAFLLVKPNDLTLTLPSVISLLRAYDALPSASAGYRSPG